MNRTMQTIFVKRKRVLLIVLVVLILYLLFRAKKFNYSVSVTIPVAHPSDVWEFVADFSNMKYLNPTIVDFDILSESGYYENWKYKLAYVENLSHWPYISNSAIASFHIWCIIKQDVYYIHSIHTTCMFIGLFCLESKSDFNFSRDASVNGAFCEEHVEYECPAVLHGFCEREVRFQRNAIMNNLKNHFFKKIRTELPSISVKLIH